MTRKSSLDKYFFSDNPMTVDVARNRSTPRPQEVGSVQGSTLGLWLFTLFTSKLHLSYLLLWGWQLCISNWRLSGALSIETSFWKYWPCRMQLQGPHKQRKVLTLRPGQYHSNSSNLFSFFLKVSRPYKKNASLWE